MGSAPSSCVLVPEGPVRGCSPPSHPPSGSTKQAWWTPARERSLEGGSGRHPGGPPGRAAWAQRQATASCCPWAAAARLPRPWTPCPLQESAMAPEWGDVDLRTANEKDLCRCRPLSKGSGGVSEGSPSSVTGVLREEGNAGGSLGGSWGTAAMPWVTPWPHPSVHHPSVHPLIACGP